MHSVRFRYLQATLGQVYSYVRSSVPVSGDSPQTVKQLLNAEDIEPRAFPRYYLMTPCFSPSIPSTLPRSAEKQTAPMFPIQLNLVVNGAQLVGCIYTNSFVGHPGLEKGNILLHIASP